MKYDAALLNTLSRDTATGYSEPLHQFMHAYLGESSMAAGVNPEVE